MIEVRDEDGIAVVEIAHGKANALDLELCRAVSEFLREREQAGAPALVFTGRGSIFSAGVDLIRLLDGGPDYARVFVPVLALFARSVFAYPGPVVAAINGHAVAGGCVFACAADRRLMADTGGRVGIPELRVGVPFPAAAIEVMRAVLSPARFRTLVLGGATLEPAGAREWGLIDDIVPPENLLASAVAAARDLASIPAGTYALTKMQMRRPALARMDLAGRASHDELMRLWTSPATFDAVREYVERTLGPRRTRPPTSP